MLELKQNIYNTELSEYEEVAFYDLTLVDFTCSYELMGDRSISGDIFSNEDIPSQEWISNCFVTYRGEKWRLYKSPVRAEENSIYKYKYTCTFEPLINETKNIPFIDIVTGSSISSGLSDVVFNGNIIELVDRIIANLERIGEWTYSLDVGVSTTDYREVSLSNASIYEAIQSIYSIYGIKYNIIGNQILIGYASQVIDYEFSQGKENGLYEIVKTPTDDIILAYARGCGSTKNMPINYYSTGRFALNPCPRYAQNLLPSIYTQGGSGIAVWERDYYQSDAQVTLGNKNEKFLTFDGSEYEEIYPTIKGITYSGQRIDKIKSVGSIGSDIINADGTIKDKTFELTLHPLGFDIAKIISNQGELTLSITSGDCVGCNFKVIKINGVNTNPSKATNAFGSSKLIANVTDILDGNYDPIAIASFYRYSLDGDIKIGNAYLGDNSGFGINDNNNNTDEYILYIRTYLYNSITKETVEVDVKQFTSPTLGTDLWDLSGQLYIEEKTILSEDVSVGNWTLYMQPIVDITDGLSGTSQKTFIVTTRFDENTPLIVIGDITADEGTISPIDEDVIITVEKSITDYNTLLPNANLSVSVDDEYVFINAALPDAYVIDAEQRLGQAIQDYIDKNDFEKYNFNIKLDSKIVNLDEELLPQLSLGYSIKLEQLTEALEIVNITITHKDSQIFDEYDIKISPTAKRIIGISKVNNTIQRVNGALASKQNAIVAYALSLYNSLNLVQAKAFSAAPAQEVSGGTSLDSSTLGATIFASASKNTPSNTDSMVLSDINDSNKAKKISWTNIKSVLKSYFDTVYSAIGHTHSQYLTTETDPTVGSHIKAITTTNISNWNVAYSAVNAATDAATASTLVKRNSNGESSFIKVTTTTLVINGWTMTID